ncbi:MAG: ATPase [Firmicutes bacterium]|nr:ATPase [Bacillota bacterium]
MKVKKKDGRIQDFNADKIKLILEKVSDEAEKPLTGSDVNIITKLVEETVRKDYKDIITTEEIHKVVVNQLKKAGFLDIAKAYDEFEKKFEKSDKSIKAEPRKKEVK